MSDMSDEAKGNGGSSGGVLITFQAMYNQLQLLVGELRDLNGSMKSHGQTATDHEIRIRNLERWKYSLPVSLLISTASIVIALVVK